MSARKRLRRLRRRLLRWSAATLASLAVFALTFWAWEALGLPPAEPDRESSSRRSRRSSAPPCSRPSVHSPNAMLPTCRKAYLSRMSGLGPEEVYPITTGTWRIGRDHGCKIVVPCRFKAAGKEHADLICDDTGFWVESLHDNGTYIDDQPHSAE